MSGRDQFDTLAVHAALGVGSAIRIGELVALAEGGVIAIVRDSANADLALMRARTIVDLHGDHIGRQVLFTVVPGAADQVVVLGVMRGGDDQAVGRERGPMSIESDGERFVVNAKQQMLLRCGKASITLTQAGKVLIEGTYVLSRSTGANRVKGASIQLN